ncbi:MAG: hypothetical protein KDC79_07065 [Cyclobacteriaceae bacterium]|nr:hypothetical protein [Cyclobacteriaceae bacterium]
MALGNNLKRLKKDSLIPEKKKETVSEPKVKKVARPKASVPEKKKDSTPKKNKEEVAQTAPVSETKATSAAQPIMAANLEEKILLGGDGNSSITAKLIPSRRKSVRKTKLIFEGSMSLLEAEAIKDCLLTTFNEYDLIDIQLSNITQLDIIPIQLIKAFVGYYPDKKVKIDSDLPFDIKIIVERAGFGSLMFKEEVA